MLTCPDKHPFTPEICQKLQWCCIFGQFLQAWVCFHDDGGISKTRGETSDTGEATRKEQPTRFHSFFPLFRLIKADRWQNNLFLVVLLWIEATDY